MNDGQPHKVDSKGPNKRQNLFKNVNLVFTCYEVSTIKMSTSHKPLSEI